MTTSLSVLDGLDAGSLPALGTRLAAGLASGWSAPAIRVGIDVLAVAEVAESLAAHGERYLERVFTPDELACCRSGVDGGYAPESLAARFAAKEAVVKVLQPADARPEWRSIEILRGDVGSCDVRLSGRAADLASEAGITGIAVSVSHEPAVAAAVAAATWRCRDEEET
jgi:holo-[acyl-carrier protein] synthase